jgi:hypothetical protein
MKVNLQNRRKFKTSRREFLTSSAMKVAGGCAAWTLAGVSAGIAADDSYVTESQPRPKTDVKLPTDALPPPEGPRKRIAAIATAYWKYSHADDIITKFIEGYEIVGRIHPPHCQIVGLHIEQTPASDIGRGLAARYRIPLHDTPAGALLGKSGKFDIDGVLLIAEHGDYPTNERGQRLYPRRRLFEEIVKVFRAAGRSVPVYSDKHFSWNWDDAAWMYAQKREIDFPMMAGSSVPVTWREPPLAFKPGVRLNDALAVGYGGVESYGFHTLELLQSFVEKRAGGETGVKAVEALQGDAAWRAAAEGRWRVDLLEAVLGVAPPSGEKPAGLEAIRRADPEATVFLVEYRDGFRAAAYMSKGRLVEDFCFAADVVGRDEPVATRTILPVPNRDHFSFLANHIEVMFRSGKPSYPVERTYLVTGVLAALMESLSAGGKRIETPHLAAVAYEPGAT